MCGLACVVSKTDQNTPEFLLRQMLRVVQHRGPDGTQIAVSRQCALGHTRLSITDISNRSSQPMRRGNHSIIFNGEIYNYVELRDELIERGHTFATTSDTEVLIIALKEWGIATLDRLNGMFAFVYLNHDEKKLYLVRDRFGIKPLIYHKSQRVFLVASECKQILKALEQSPVLNPTVTENYLLNGALNERAETFFEGISEIPKGHYGVYDIVHHTLDLHCWYRLVDRITLRKIEYGEAREAVRDLLIDSIRCRLRTDVKIGTSLSGGIDSSSIVALCASEFRESLNTVSIFHQQQGFDERKFSRCMVERFSLKNVEIQPDLNDLFCSAKHEEMVYYCDQPLPNGSHLNEYILYKTAHQMGIKVMLDGQGSDEYFGGYGEHWFAAQVELLKARKLAAFAEGITMRADSLKVDKKRVLARFLWDLASKIRAQRSRVDWLAFSQQPKQELKQIDLFHELCLQQIERTSLPYELHDTDRNSMRWSAESRLPFLDFRLVEYVLSLPTYYRIGNGYQKRILRDAIPELPRQIASRQDKIGYASPDKSAFLQSKKSAREQIIFTLDSLTGFVNSKQVIEAFDKFCETGIGYDPIFFRLLSMGAWSRAFNCTL
jgi:asparagine synthase (glutamine-hydrolysing)